MEFRNSLRAFQIIKTYGFLSQITTMSEMTPFEQLSVRDFFKLTKLEQGVTNHRGQDLAYWFVQLLLQYVEIINPFQFFIKFLIRFMTTSKTLLDLIYSQDFELNHNFYYYSWLKSSYLIAQWLQFPLFINFEISKLQVKSLLFKYSFHSFFSRMVLHLKPQITNSCSNIQSLYLFLLIKSNLPQTLWVISFILHSRVSTRTFLTILHSKYALKIFLCYRNFLLKHLIFFNMLS